MIVVVAVAVRAAAMIAVAIAVAIAALAVASAVAAAMAVIVTVVVVMVPHLRERVAQFLGVRQALVRLCRHAFIPRVCILAKRGRGQAAPLALAVKVGFGEPREPGVDRVRREQALVTQAVAAQRQLRRLSIYRRAVQCREHRRICCARCLPDRQPRQ